MPRRRVPIPTEEPTAAVGAEEEASPAAAPPPPEYLRVIITLRDGRGSIGVQRFGCDPYMATMTDAELANALALVPELLAAADGIWQERRQNPKYTRPAPPPRPPAPPRAARTPPAPAAPAGPQMTPLF